MVLIVCSYATAYYNDVASPKKHDVVENKLIRRRRQYFKSSNLEENDISNIVLYTTILHKKAKICSL